jgi:hypothetical protein
MLNSLGCARDSDLTDELYSMRFFSYVIEIDLTNTDDKYTKIIGNFGGGVTAIILEPTDLMAMLEKYRKTLLYTNK